MESVTQKMVQAYHDAWHRTKPDAPGTRTRAGLEAALAAQEPVETPEDLKARLEAALEDMLDLADGRPVSARWAARLIQERVLGPAEPLEVRLEAALQELEAMDSVESTTWAASFIQGRVLGGETGR